MSCLDESGNPVDRWVAIKQPKSGDYYYYTDDGDTFVKSDFTVTQTDDGMIMDTINQMYGKSFNLTNYIFGMYNDEPPPDATASSSYAHAKGVLITDTKQGFWLVHSMPHWPPTQNQGPGEFPDTTYGQSLQCITMSAANADLVATGLMTSRPYIYDKNIGDAVAGQLPNFESWLGGTHSSDPSSVTIPLKSWNGAVFTQLEKASTWGKDFWDDLVAPYYSTALNVETWRSGSGGRIGSICGTGGEKTDTYDVLEVASIKMPDGTAWAGTTDHSKWAVGVDADMYCIGDLNRMCSQESRGGGGVCRTDSGISKAMRALVAGVEACWAYDPCSGAYDSCYWCPADVSLKAALGN